MRDCENCKLARNGDCAQLECQGFVPLPKMTNEDREIYKNAAERLDWDRHPQNKHGGRRVAEAEERIKQAKNNPASKPEPKPAPKPRSKGKTKKQQNTQRTENKPKHPTIDIGKPLFYKNRFTGRIQSGIVVAKSWYTFVFIFDNRTVTLPYKVIGTRLFLSAQEAQAKGKFTGP